MMMMVVVVGSGGDGDGDGGEMLKVWRFKLHRRRLFC